MHTIQQSQAMRNAGWFSVGTIGMVGAILTGALMNTIGASNIPKIARIAVPTILGAAGIAGMAVGAVGQHKLSIGTYRRDLDGWS